MLSYPSDRARIYHASNRSGSLSITFSLSYDLHIYPFEKRLQVRSAQYPFPFLRSTVRSKLTLLQALAPNPITTGIKRQNLEQAPTPINENKPMPARRVLSQMSTHTRRQSVKGTAHIGRLRAKPDPTGRDRVQHDRELRTRRTTPPPSSSSTSHDEDWTGSTSETSTNIDSHGPLCCAVLSRSLRLQRSKVLSDTPCDKQKLLRV